MDLIEGDAPKAEIWTPPILKCVATRGEGTAEIVDALERHHAWLETTETGRARRLQRLAEEVRESLREALIEEASAALGKELDDAVRSVAEKAIDPYSAIEQLLVEFRRR